jgi:hypothetical protein
MTNIKGCMLNQGLRIKEHVTVKYYERQTGDVRYLTCESLERFP